MFFWRDPFSVYILSFSKAFIQRMPARHVLQLLVLGSAWAARAENGSSSPPTPPAILNVDVPSTKLDALGPMVSMFSCCFHVCCVSCPVSRFSAFVALHFLVTVGLTQVLEYKNLTAEPPVRFELTTSYLPGPIVVQKDGSLRRISNWAEMGVAERAAAQRVVAQRNEARLNVLREQQGAHAQRRRTPRRRAAAWLRSCFEWWARLQLRASSAVCRWWPRGAAGGTSRRDAAGHRGGTRAAAAAQHQLCRSSSCSVAAAAGDGSVPRP